VKYLITGGAGFIGSHLVEQLVSRGDSVTVLDDLSTGNVNNLSKVMSRIEVQDGNILDEVLINRLISKSDYVVHLAAALGVFNIVNQPLKSLRTNLKGSEIVLEAVDKHKKPILLASTSEIYGKNDKIPLNEEDDRIVGHPLISRWSYSEAKAIDESLAFFYHQENGLPIRIVRFFNTSGPRQVGDYGMVLPRFVSSALRNEQISVFGDGSQTRCFCHVSDTVRAILLVMDSEKSVGQVFNVGNDQQISIMELANMVVKTVGSSSRIATLPYLEAYAEGFEDMLRRVPDISKIKKSLGWSPKIGLDQIIQDVVDFQSSKP
jgi:UDP-glucose 4-epimerase